MFVLTNKEVFAKYNDQQFIIEEQVYHAIREYWEKHCQKYNAQPPANIVGFVKIWMKQESIANTEIVDLNRSREKETENIIIDAEFCEIE